MFRNRSADPYAYIPSKITVVVHQAPVLPPLYRRTAATGGAVAVADVTATATATATATVTATATAPRIIDYSPTKQILRNHNQYKKETV